jgi:hypothetical protein
MVHYVSSVLNLDGPYVSTKMVSPHRVNGSCLSLHFEVEWKAEVGVPRMALLQTKRTFALIESLPASGLKKCDRP